MATTSITFAETPLVTLTLRRADDALVLGHRLSEWSGFAPTLEEDLALSNLGLDLIGQARALYQYAAEQLGPGHSEDTLAYLRDPGAWRNCLLVEQPNGDFAHTIVRQLFYGVFMHGYWQATTASRDATLAAIAAKAEKEMAYHVRHAGDWLIRLGDGTAESHARAAEALEALWIYTGELFEVDATEQALIDAGIAADPRPLEAPWRALIEKVVRTATLTMPKAAHMQTGGRRGRHSEHLGHLLAEMQIVQRTYPGQTW